jgi:CBS domain-containing protein
MSVQVAAILNRKGSEVHTIARDATVSEAATLLAEHGIGALVVSSDQRSVEGIISERDIVRHLASEGASSLERRVDEVMTSDVTTTEPGVTADDLMGMMTEARIRHVPVIQDGELAGLVSIGDVVKSRIDVLEIERNALQRYVTHGY